MERYDEDSNEGLVASNGFTKKCTERMDEEGIMHWDLEDITSYIEE